MEICLAQFSAAQHRKIVWPKDWPKNWPKDLSGPVWSRERLAQAWSFILKRRVKMVESIALT
jgi:hypothetical protein